MIPASFLAKRKRTSPFSNRQPTAGSRQVPRYFCVLWARALMAVRRESSEAAGIAVGAKVPPPPGWPGTGRGAAAADAAEVGERSGLACIVSRRDGAASPAFAGGAPDGVAMAPGRLAPAGFSSALA